MARIETDEARLLRAGFYQPERAKRLLGDSALHNMDHEWLIDQLCAVGDPDEGLVSFLRFKEAAQQAGFEALAQLDAVLKEERAARRLFAILGFSHPLTDQLIKNPSYVHILRDAKVGAHPFDTSLEKEKASALAAVHAEKIDLEPKIDRDPSSHAPVHQYVSADDPDAGVNAMRAHYWYRIAQVAAEDLIGTHAPAIMPAVSRAITDIVGGALEASLAVGRAAIPGAERVGLSIIAMGKAGARELNYISDVDVVYVARALDPDMPEAQMLSLATKLATFVAGAVSKTKGDQKPLWELDANLRPEGKDGPLVRTLESHLAYYKRWAHDWEFQALLKARPIAGDMVLGESYCAAMNPMVWSAAERPNFVEDSRAMRRRVESLVPAKDADRQLKLGKGGLRDVEFTVQLLQLVHGRTDTSLRRRNTLRALEALSVGGYIARADAEKLAYDYRFLRALEHRIQLQRFRRSHTVPRNKQELRRIARALHGVDVDTDEQLEEYWQRVRHEVRHLHLSIYYRPILPQMARLSSADVSLDAHAAQARLAAIGYRDPSQALNHIKALTAGISRTAAIQRQLLPVMIGWFASGPEPDHGLQAFRVLSETMGHTSWYMRLLRDSSAVAERLAYILSTSRYIARELPKLPEAMSWLDDDALLAPRTDEQLASELESLLSRRSEPQRIAEAGRYLRRKELLRTAMADVALKPTVAQSIRAISCAGEIALEAGLRAALSEVTRLEPLLVDMAIIGMGRFGGYELNYASDADVLFVYEPHVGADIADADAQANHIARRVIALLAETGSEPVYDVDAGLRPEGKNGALARSLDSYEEYYMRWADTWECQALLRARFVSGDERVGKRFISIIDPVRYPEQGLSASDIRDIRAMKARMERERMPRSVDPLRHLKLGRGSLSDVEWTIQYLQMQYAGEYQHLRVPGTLQALQAAVEVGVLQADDATKLEDAWSFASLLRNLNVLATGRMHGMNVDILPKTADEHRVVQALAGYAPGHGSELDEDWLRQARHARAVMERIFYGIK